jgi:hypothetical protein
MTQAALRRTEEPHALATAMGEHAIAVVLDLVQPIGADGGDRFRSEGRA